MATVFHLKTYKKGLDSMDTLATAYLQNKIKGKKYPLPTPRQIRREAKAAAQRAIEDEKNGDPNHSSAFH